MNILLSYSRKHFNPGVYESTHSAGILAKAIYEVCSELGQVEYVDWNENPKCSSYDMVVTLPRHLTQLKDLSKNVYCFPAIAEPIYTKYALSYEANKLGCKLSDCYTPNLKFDNVKYLVIGNDHIKYQYERQGITPTMLSYGMPGEFSRRKKDKEDTTVFLHVATTLGLRKGFYHVVRDFIRANIANSKLICMGRVQHGETFWYDFVKSINDPRIEIKPFIESNTKEYQEVFKNAHYFIYPSLSEGQPGTALEAMALGCVPLLTETSGIDFYPLRKYQRGERGAEVLREAARVYGQPYFDMQTRVQEAVQRKYNIEAFKDKLRRVLNGKN